MHGQPNSARVCVLGLGYIGLPTASVIASRGVQVIGVDVNEDVVAKINRGEIHIVEPDLEAVTAHAVEQGYAARRDHAGSRRMPSSSPCRRRFMTAQADLSYV